MFAPFDLEAELVTLLDDLAESVATRVPKNRPSTCIRVTRAGGQARNAVQADSRALVECWAPEGEAFALAASAWARILQHYGAADTWGGTASLTDPVNLPDTSAVPENARYQFLVTVTTNLTAA